MTETEMVEEALVGRCSTYDEGWLRMSIKTGYSPDALMTDDLVELPAPDLARMPWIARLEFKCPRCTLWKDFVCRGRERREAIETVLSNVARHGLNCDSFLGEAEDYL